MADEKDSVLESVPQIKAVYKRLGKSGLRVSVPILGTMSFGPRHKNVILSKCWGRRRAHDPCIVYGQKISESKEHVNNGGLSRVAIFNANILISYRFTASILTLPIEETMEALHDLIKIDEVRYIGASSTWTYHMQNHSTLLYREEREMIKFCHDTGVGLIPKHEWKMTHVALAWINKRVSSPIIGFSSLERIDEALDSNGKVSSEEEEKYLEESYVSRDVSGHS
ncbi:NADP-dependent oxidoreductase domain-containing protein [Delphinella strobiligena]|nr:NADP-dependent oxidoreductase domain-containing protein [Delphinella strobiligena]